MRVCVRACVRDARACVRGCGCVCVCARVRVCVCVGGGGVSVREYVCVGLKY